MVAAPVGTGGGPMPGGAPERPRRFGAAGAGYTFRSDRVSMADINGP